jgi:hypothetical protein
MTAGNKTFRQNVRSLFDSLKTANESQEHSVRISILRIHTRVFSVLELVYRANMNL